MKPATSILAGIAIIFTFFSSATLAIHDYPAEPFWLDSSEINTASIDHAVWQSLLDQYLVTDTPSGINLVDYARLKRDGLVQLNEYLTALSRVTITEYSKAEQFAFWVNLYNAATVKLIVDAYPVKSIMKLGKGWFSIGPWNDEIVTVQGKVLTLNDIEHRILRPIWQDYRIHFVVNCASLGCPNLGAKALTAQNTAAILDESARDFLQHPRGFSANSNQIQLSKIFKWYQSDFGADEDAVLTTLKPFLRAIDKTALEAANLRIRYQYDWSLNEAN